MIGDGCPLCGERVHYRGLYGAQCIGTGCSNYGAPDAGAKGSWTWACGQHLANRKVGYFRLGSVEEANPFELPHLRDGLHKVWIRI
jgi:hypothetical protein